MSLLVALLFALPAQAQEPGYGDLIADSAASIAEDASSLTVRPVAAAIGEPVEWILTVHHPARDTVRLADEDPVPDDTWVLVDGPRIATERDGSGGAVTRVTWTVFSIEPGDRPLPEISARLASGIEIRVASPGSLAVRGELEEGEDAPRPLAGLHAVQERVGNGGGVVAGLAVLLLVAGIVWVVLRRRSARTPEPGLSPMERIDVLRGEPADDPETARAIVFELTQLLRAAVDRRAGALRPGATDEEWLASVRASDTLDANTFEELQRLVTGSEEVKYGRHVPTRLAVADSLHGAQRILAALDDQERREREGAAA